MRFIDAFHLCAHHTGTHFAAEIAVLAPAGWSFEEASTIPCAAVTAWSSLVTHGGLQAVDWALVQGTGGVALFGLQIAVAAGAKVAVISSSDEKLAKTKAMGAAVGINYVNQPE
jgi:NADPH:quinone reductase-like Zn-dependent oxidoreductase